MTTSQPGPQKSWRRRLGCVLLLAPFGLAATSSLWLYLWIVVNDYQGSESVAYAWFVYAVSFLVWFGLPLLMLGVLSVVFGIILSLSEK